MNILFLTLCDISSINEKMIYTDLLREFIRNNHYIYIVSPTEKRFNKETEIIRENKSQILKVVTGKIQKTNIIEKGISTLLLENQFGFAIKKYFLNIKFDLVIYSTPPITLTSVIRYVKKRDNAKSYLLLKDIFPQNAVDLNMFSKANPIYIFFRNKEKKIYQLSDYIGCMSQANVDYVIKHNPDIKKEKVHVLPNSIENVEICRNHDTRIELRAKYNIPHDKKVFIYGGNLGKPQDIPFIIECLKANAEKMDRFFIICGTGTEYPKLKAYIDEYSPRNALLINGLSKNEYETLLIACDAGLIFLDHRFTIPNFPSRLLSYMQNSMPVIACTDKNTDIGKVILEGEFGWWCESDDVDNFTNILDFACTDDLITKSNNAKKYLLENYTIEQSYRIIMEKLK